MREDWIECELGDLLKLKNGFAFKASNYKTEGIPVFRIGDINDWIVSAKNAVKIEEKQIYDDFIVENGDILIAMSGATTGKFGIYNSTEKAYQNQRVGNLKLYSENALNKNFIFYLLYSLKRDIERDAYGGAQPNISGIKIEALKTKLAPLPIQRAIVSKIEALFSDLDNGIANFKKAQEQLKIYRQAVLKKAFEGELTKEWRVKTGHALSQQGLSLPTAEELLKQIKEERQNHYNQQIEDWKKAVKDWEKKGSIGKKPSKPTALSLEFDLSKTDQELKELPNNWAYITLDFATYKLGDGLHGTPKYDENGEYWFINGNNLNNGKIILKPETKKVSFAEFEKYKKDLNKDTIFVSINGTIGNVSFYNDEKVILGKSACYFNLLSSFDKNYIRWQIDSFGFMQYAVRNATGSTIKNVPLSAMRNFVFPLCSTQEQTQIVQEIESRLSVCDKMEHSINESIEKAEALRQSILKKAFEGRLLSAVEVEQCKQAADYEPASELLKKIQAEKLAKELEKKKPIVKKKGKK